MLWASRRRSRPRSVPSRRPAAAQQRAARERAERLQQVLARLPELQAKKKADDKDQARASGTDPQATVMKMADGGFIAQEISCRHLRAC